jgi:3-deoxy-manno-octulosonate cytidylyltransferase (CMP-KDO synthetase)
MTSLPQTPLEKAESLEQLRALENGMKIKTHVVDFVPVGIDTKDDLEKFRKIVEEKMMKL